MVVETWLRLLALIFLDVRQSIEAIFQSQCILTLLITYIILLESGLPIYLLPLAAGKRIEVLAKICKVLLKHLFVSCVHMATMRLVLAQEFVHSWRLLLHVALVLVHSLGLSQLDDAFP